MAAIFDDGLEQFSQLDDEGSQVAKIGTIRVMSFGRILIVCHTSWCLKHCQRVQQMVISEVNDLEQALWLARPCCGSAVSGGRCGLGVSAVTQRQVRPLLSSDNLDACGDDHPGTGRAGRTGSSREGMP